MQASTLVQLEEAVVVLPVDQLISQWRPLAMVLVCNVSDLMMYTSTLSSKRQMIVGHIFYNTHSDFAEPHIFDYFCKHLFLCGIL